MMQEMLPFVQMEQQQEIDREIKPEIKMELDYIS